MNSITVMLKPSSSACNLRCKYCFYADLAGKRDTFSFGKMTEDTVLHILDNIFSNLNDGDQLHFTFQGGEPTLVGLDWYKSFVEMVSTRKNKINIGYALQTNGTLLDDAWCEFLHQNNFLVGISIDAMPKTHNSCRIDIDNKGTYNSVLNTVLLMRKHKVEFNVLCTLTSEIAQHPQQVWKWICQNNFDYVQFTPCLGNLDEPGKSPYALRPKRFATFYTELFKLWLMDLRLGKYRSIKLFDDIVNLLAYGVPTSCGINGRCTCQIVVESDGSVYPCDFYCIDKYRMGSLTDTSVMDLLKSNVAQDFLTRHKEKSSLCNTCPYSQFCGGGCHRMQREIYCAPEDTYCGYKAFLDYSINDFKMIAISQRRMRR